LNFNNILHVADGST